MQRLQETWCGWLFKTQYSLSVQHHSWKLYTSKNHWDKQAFAFYFHPILVHSVQDCEKCWNFRGSRKQQNARSHHRHTCGSIYIGKAGSPSSSKKGSSRDCITSQHAVQNSTAALHTYAVACLSYQFFRARVTCATRIKLSTGTPARPLSHLHFVLQINQDDFFSVLVLQELG